MSGLLARMARHGATHFAVAFLAMGSWAAFSNRYHPMPAPLTAAVIQGVVSGAITLALKSVVEHLARRFSGWAALLAPPVIACVLSAVIALTMHRLGGTPEIGRTIAPPLTISTTYAALYSLALWNAGKGSSMTSSPLSDQDPASAPAGKDRRPLNSRNKVWARETARILSEAGVSPNKISAASMVMAACAGFAFLIANAGDFGSRGFLLLLAAAFCQLRLICNLLDGMVAIEGGKQSPDGPFWNEFPDRISDLLIFAGLGHGIGLPTLGWAVVGLSILTAYTRELGSKCGLPADYCGPMAKQHRMAVITVAALLSLFDPIWDGWNVILALALWAIAFGTAATTVRRAWRIVRALRAKG